MLHTLAPYLLHNFFDVRHFLIIFIRRAEVNIIVVSPLFTPIRMFHCLIVVFVLRPGLPKVSMLF